MLAFFCLFFRQVCHCGMAMLRMKKARAMRQRANRLSGEV
jgi:hypothetical protein